MLYRIMTETGKLVGTTDKVLYVKYSNNGSLIEAEPFEAVGIAYMSKAYNLPGRKITIPDAETVTVTEVDEGTILDGIKSGQAEGIDTQFIVMSALADMYDDIMAEIATIKTQITPK